MLWNVPLAFGLIHLLLCSPIGRRNFKKETKQKIATDWTLHSVTVWTENFMFGCIKSQLRYNKLLGWSFPSCSDEAVSYIALQSDRPVAIMAKLERYDGDDVSFGSATSLSLSLSFILQRRHRRRRRLVVREVVYICPQISKHPMNGTGISGLGRKGSSKNF